MKRILFFAIFILVLSGGFFLAIQKEGHSKPIKIGVMDWSGFYPAIVAQEMGYFKNRGLNVELVYCKDNPEINSKLTSGEIQFGFGTLTDHVLLADSGVPIKFILVSDYSITDSLVGKKTIKSLKDLKGKTIGISEVNSFSDFFVINLLQSAGLSELDVKFKIVPFDKISEALKSGLIDAGHTWEPELSTAIGMGYHVIETSASFPGLITDGLSYRFDQIKDSKIVEKVLLGISDGINLYENDIRKYAEVIGPNLSYSPETAFMIVNQNTPPLPFHKNVMAFSDLNSDEGLTHSVHKVNDFFYNRGQLKSTSLNTDLIDAKPFLTAFKGVKP